MSLWKYDPTSLLIFEIPETWRCDYSNAQDNSELISYKQQISTRIWRSGDRASWSIIIIKPTRCINFQIYFWNKTLHVSDSSSVHHQEFFAVHTGMVYVVQVCWRQAVSKPLWHIPLLVHLAGFIIWIYKNRYLQFNIPTNTVKQTPFSKANIGSVSQYIPHHCLETKFTIVFSPSWIGSIHSTGSHPASATLKLPYVLNRRPIGHQFGAFEEETNLLSRPESQPQFLCHLVRITFTNWLRYSGHEWRKSDNKDKISVRSGTKCTLRSTNFLFFYLPRIKPSNLFLFINETWRYGKIPWMADQPIYLHRTTEKIKKKKTNVHPSKYRAVLKPMNQIAALLVVTFVHSDQNSPTIMALCFSSRPLTSMRSVQLRN